MEGEAGAKLLTTTVASDLNGPGTCEVIFADPERSLLRNVGADFGQDLEVHASAVEERADEPVFVGHVYALEFQADETGCVSIIRGYDSTFALRQRRAITSYNDVSDSDLVRTLCSDAGVEVGNVSCDGSIHPYVAQLNETHWDFLCRRAERQGAHLHATGGKVHFEPVADSSDAPEPGDHQSTDPLQLTPGLNLLYLRARVSSAQQVGEVEVRGWDPAEKREVSAREKVATDSVAIELKPADVGGSHGTNLRIAARPAVSEASMCRTMAKSYAERVATAFSFIEGKAYGDPRLVAGKAVAIGRSGRFDGQYTLTSVRHVFDQEGYFTFLTVSGEHDRSLFGLLNSDGGTTQPGLYPAIVTNIRDPDELGRVKLRLPWLAEDFETNWCRVMQIGAGPDRGLLIFPEVEDEVLVAFLGDDASHPVVLGGLYNGVDRPPSDGYADGGDGTIDIRGLRSRIGHSLILSDKGGDEKIVIETADQSVTLTFDQSGGGNVSLEASGDVSVKAGGAIIADAGADITGKAQGNIDLQASGNASLKASGNLTIEAGGVVQIKGSVVNLN